MRTNVSMILLAALAFAPPALAQTGQAAPQPEAAPGNPSVGGVAMDATKTIAANAAAAPNLSTLVSAVQAAGLAETLNGPGPFTVFAPTNAAFAKLPAGTVDTLLKPENKGTLTAVLTYHVVAGKVSATQLAAKVKMGGGKAMLTTVQGGMLTFAKAGKGYTVTDAKGNAANITIADVNQSNGVIHVIDGVLLP